MGFKTVWIVVTLICRILIVLVGSILDRLTCSATFRNLSRRITREMLSVLIPESRFSIKNHHLCNAPKTLYVSNHYGWFDGIIINHLFPNIKLVAKDFALIDNPFLSDWFTIKSVYKLLGNGIWNCDSDDSVMVLGEGGYPSFVEMVVDKDPNHLWVFPAGGLIKKTYRTGCFRMAKLLGWKVCPVKLSGFPSLEEDGLTFPEGVIEMGLTFLPPFMVDDPEVDAAKCEELLRD